MNYSQELIFLFHEFQKLPKGYLIDNPKGLILLDIVLPKKFIKIIKCSDSRLFFTRASLKHIAEKNHDAESFLGTIHETLRYPDRIHKSKHHRFIFTKIFHKNEKPYPYVVGLEVAQKNIIITTFIANESYLRNFEILWRTETLSDGPSIST